MIPFHEHTSLLRKLVFNGSIIIDRSTTGKPLMLIDATEVPNIFETVACPRCDMDYSPFQIGPENLIWIKPSCDPCLVLIYSGQDEDKLLNAVTEMMKAKAYLLKFDNLCAENPWLIQESFAYQNCFMDWCAEYDKLKKEFEAFALKVVETAGKRNFWFTNWFGR